MEISGNTILITGGGSGIGRGLAEAFHKLGNQVIIAGRRQAVLDEVVASNPGMKSLRLDIANAGDIGQFAAEVKKQIPRLNVLINNAGIQHFEKVESNNVSAAEETIRTNLLGPIRLTAALLPLLRQQPKSTIMMVSSRLAFVPLSIAPTYCATKAAIHSYSESLRYQLRQTTTEVIELIPPYVQTSLGEKKTKDPRALPLDEFVDEVMEILKTPGVSEVVVERCKPVRFAAENGKYEETFHALNAEMAYLAQ